MNLIHLLLFYIRSSQQYTQNEIFYNYEFYYKKKKKERI